MPTERTHHGDTVIDEYAWLADKDDPDTVAYLTAENAYTEARTADLAGLRETIFNEIKTRTQETDLSVPIRKGGYWYYTRTVEGQQYGIHCRRAVAPRRDRPAGHRRRRPAARRADPARRQRRGRRLEFFALGTFDVSPDGHLLAYSVDLDRRRAVHPAGQGPAHRRACCPTRSTGRLLRLGLVAPTARRCST